MADEKTPTRLELIYDADAGVYKAKLPRWLLGANPYPALKAFSFTEEDIRNMPGLSYIKEDNKIIGAYVQFSSANDYAQENQSQEKPSKEEITPEEAQRIREGEELPDQEYAYRQGRLVTEKNIDEFVQIDPVTRQVNFITADAPGAGVYGGTAEGGTPSPRFAVIIPREFGVGGGPSATGAMVYDTTVVQESFIKNLTATDKLAEFKQLLAEKGFYTLAGFKDFEIQSSLRQGKSPDEFFGIALDRYLSELSQQNYNNVKQGLNPFGIDDYIQTVQQDFDALSAYVPSDREAETVLKSTYSQYVGRMPSAEEIQAFKFALEAEATANPRRSAVDMVTGMETTYEGFTADQLESFASEYTLSRPEAEEFGAGQGGLNAISNVFERIANKARQEVQSVVRPGSL
jgi:hypothetical protein